MFGKESQAFLCVALCFFLCCKPGILRAQLQRLIPRALWNPNGRQALPKSFNTAACPRLDSNPGPWLS